MARIEEGMLREAYNHFDFIGLWEQLGYLPQNSFEQGLSGNKSYNKSFKYAPSGQDTCCAGARRRLIWTLCCL